MRAWWGRSTVTYFYAVNNTGGLTMLERASDVARSIVIAKIANSRSSLLRAMRDHSESSAVPELEKASDRLARVLVGLENTAPLEYIRGKEGEAGKLYFGVFDHLITAQRDDFTFRERSRRPPLDNVNALLSFAYTLLVHDVTSACEAVGLDPGSRISTPGPARSNWTRARFDGGAAPVSGRSICVVAY